MTLQDTLQEDLKRAMKAGDVVARQCLRMAIAALKNRRIEAGSELSETAELAVLAKEVKKRLESAGQYAAAGRDDLAAIERAEAEVLQRYLPLEFDEAEVRVAVQAAIEATGASSKKDLGAVMKAVMAEHRGRVDGKLVQRIAGELLE